MARDLSAAEAREPVTRPPLSYPLQDHPRTRPAIRFAKHDGPSAGCGQLRATSAYSGPGPGQPARWLTACARHHQPR